MKTTDHFKRTIQMFLEQRAAEDELFAKSYRNPAKNIDGRVRDPHSELCAEKRLQRLHGRRDLWASHPLLYRK